MNRAIKIKLGLLLLFTGLTATFGVLYLRSFSQSAMPSEEMADRWKKLHALPAPPAGLVLQQTVDGGCHSYGIDANLQLLVEVTNADRAATMEALAKQVTDFYAQALTEWHGGLVNQGKSGEMRIVQGVPGLAAIEVRSFWYHDAVEKEYSGPFAEHVLSRYPESDGLGRRFADIHIVLCIRE